MIEGRDLDQTSDATPKVIVYIIKVDPKDCDQIVERLLGTGTYELKNLPGFIEARVIVSDDSTHIIAESSWLTRHDWSHSRWDEEVQKCFGVIHEVAKDID